MAFLDGWCYLSWYRHGQDTQCTLDDLERFVYEYCDRRLLKQTHQSCLAHDYEHVLSHLTWTTHSMFSPLEQMMEYQRVADMIKLLSTRKVTERPLFQMLVKEIRDILESSSNSRVVVICSSPAFQSFFDYCNSHSDSYFECLVLRDTSKPHERWEDSKMLSDFNSHGTSRVICVPTSISTIGVNLQCATHLLIPEPLWEVNDFEQTLGRLERQLWVVNA